LAGFQVTLIGRFWVTAEGLVGGVLGGWIFGKLGISAGGGMIGSIVVAFVGAVILVGITRLLKRA
jgi:uncharacterized membrane protein YeaQ/YmgE (transglycosylase-associated protein family)